MGRNADLIFMHGLTRGAGTHRSGRPSARALVGLCLVASLAISCAAPPLPMATVTLFSEAGLAPVAASAPTGAFIPAPQTAPEMQLPQASLIPVVDSEWLIIVRRSRQQIVLYRAGQEQKTYTISTGKPETITPLGWWKIVEKYPVDPPGIYGTRWLGWQRWNPRSGRYEWYKESPPFGIHGTNEPEKIGTAVSSGCVRLPNHDVEEVYDLIPTGTYVLVVE